MDESNKEVRRAKTELVNQLTKVGIEESEAKKEISILFKEFGEDNLTKTKEIVNQRIKDRTPLQYLLKKAYFMDFEVKVNKRVLIPRPETEILVEETVKRLLTNNDVLRVLDIGTGSGIIPIALAKLIPNIKIIAIDLEEDIIDLALENAKKFSLGSKIDFKKCDLFSDSIHELLQMNKFDLIISNPPYCKLQEIRNSPPEVYLHEPQIAFSGSKDNITGLIYYERIFELVRKYVNKSRHCEEQSDEAISLRGASTDCFVRAKALPRNDVVLVALEIDWPLVDGLKDLLRRENLNNYEIIKDYAKLDRYLFIYC